MFYVDPSTIISPIVFSISRSFIQVKRVLDLVSVATGYNLVEFGNFCKNFLGLVKWDIESRE